MSFFLKLWWRWRLRGTPRDHLVEIYALTVLAARRCAYDLRHASEEIPEDSLLGRDYYHDRASHWLQIFQPDGGKRYRHELHHEIDRLEMRISDLQRRLREAGLDDGEEPF